MDCFGIGRGEGHDGVRRLPPLAPVHPPSRFLIARPGPDRASRSARSFVVSRL